MKIKAVVFDAYGTLFDVYSIQVLADDFYPGKGFEIAVKWRDKQIEYTRLITCRVPDDCIDLRRYPLLIARDVMRGLIEQFCSESVGVSQPC